MAQPISPLRAAIIDYLSSKDTLVRTKQQYDVFDAKYRKVFEELGLFSEDTCCEGIDGGSASSVFTLGYEWDGGGADLS